MRIDIIVPNFDESSNEVTLSTWYKKVGDKVSKGEVIADAETSSIACGITSSYDCIITKILVREGETISQGTKIAVIETDLSSNMSEIDKKEAREEVEEILQEIDTQINHDIKVAKEQASEEIHDKMNEVKLHVEDQDKIDFENGRHEKIEHGETLQSSISDNKSQDQSHYTLSVPQDDENDKNTIKNVIDNIANDSIKLEGKIIDNFASQAEQKFKDMMKNAEAQAIAEADKLRQDIVAEAKRQATEQAEALKTKILKDCEDKAMKDANEMHQKIIQGSISEAEETKSKLLSDAKEQAQTEADAIKKSIIENAEKSAKEIAEAIKQEEIDKAKKTAEAKAEALSKEIMEKAISESKADAKAVKKDIMHSAHKHIAKEAESIIRASREEAQILAKSRIKELMSIVMMFAEKEASLMKEEVLQNRENIAEISEALEQEICNLKEEFSCSALGTKELISSAINFAENEIQGIKETVENTDNQIQCIITDAIRFANNKAGQLEATVLHEAKRIAEERANTLLEAVLTTLPQEINNVKMQVLEHAKRIAIEQAKEVIGATNKAVLDNVYQMQSELRESTQSTVQASVSSIVNTVKSDVAKSVLNELKQEQNQATCDCRCDNVLHAKVSESVVQSEPNSSSKNECSHGEVIHNLMTSNNCEKNSGECPENWQKPKFLATPDDKNEEIDLVRRRLSERRSDAYDASVISTVSNEVDMSAIIALENNFGQEFSEKYNTRLGFTPFFIKASVDALKKYRIFNAHIHENEILYKENFDISIITYGNDGVSAPVIRQADKMSIAEIEKSMIALSKRALDGTLSIEEVSGGTFTVINAGIYGSMIGTDLLTPPQVATLSVHKMKNKPVATGNGIEVKPILYISLSYDHRISDTRQASEFLSHIKQFVENPGWQVLGLGE